MRTQPPHTPRPRTATELLELTHQDQRWRFGRRVLDIRTSETHHPGAVSLPVPPDAEWSKVLPSHLLGDRNAETVVLAETTERAAQAAAHLCQRGWHADFAAEPWPEGSLAAGRSEGELWRPDPYLLEMLPSLPPPPAGAVVDLGAGSGRDSCFLASLGYNCLLVDRYPDALELARERARRLGVSIRTRRQDLREDRPVAGEYSVALNIRFLERSVFAHLPAMLKPGGVLLVHTFAPSPRAEEPGEIRARFRLDPEEFLALLPEPGWEFRHGPKVVTAAGERWVRGLARRR